MTKKELGEEELLARKRATAERKRQWELARGDYRKEWNARNREMKRAWSLANKGSVRASKMKGRATRARAIVPWRTSNTVERVKNLSLIQQEAKTLGISLHIDHMVPICGTIKGTQLRVVCGLHVDYNLQLLPERANLIKGCRHWDNMWDYTNEDIRELRERSEALNE